MTNETNQVDEEMVKAEAEAHDVIEEEVKNHVDPKKEEDFKAKYYYLAAEIENMVMKSKFKIYFEMSKN